MNKVTPPPVEALVSIFKQHNWTPTETSGAMANCFTTGHCCAIPAMIKHLDPGFEESWQDDNGPYSTLYQMGMSKLEVASLYQGFDDISTHYSNHIEWYNLGLGLRRALGLHCYQTELVAKEISNDE